MRKYLRIFLFLYAAGVAAGVFCSNLLSQKTGYQTSLLPVYLSMSLGEQKNCSGLFAQLLLQRGKILTAGILCGVTPFGIPVIVLGLLWFGFLAGSLMTLFLLEYGIKGVGAGIACFFPQALFYIPGWLLLAFAVWCQSRKLWEKQKQKKEDYRSYFCLVCGAWMLILLGVWMESYVNQNVLEYILSKWI